MTRIFLAVRFQYPELSRTTRDRKDDRDILKSGHELPKARTEHAGELVESSIALVFTLLPMVSSRNRSKIITS